MADPVPVEEARPLHTVPRPTLTVRGGTAVVELDDVDERRVALTFSPLQALRAQAVDLYVPPPGAPPLGRQVLEVTDSEWVGELAETLRRLSPHATFMERARHWIVPAGDEVIEVVAWELSLGEA